MGSLYAQSKPIDLQPKDTTVHEQEYGLRIGIDLSRPVLTFLDDNFTGFEVVGDYRLTDRMYIATEIGNEKNRREERLDNEVLYDFTTNGSYIKLGIDYNTYQNWYGMNNSIHVGGRYAFSSFSQNLDNFRIFNSNRFFNPDEFAIGSTDPQEFAGLNASWLEFVVGLKAELFANIYLGMSARIGFLITDKAADNFPNLYIPGFGKVTDNSSFGVGYNYTITYLIPLYKKANKKKKTEKRP